MNIQDVDLPGELCDRCKPDGAAAETYRCMKCGVTKCHHRISQVVAPWDDATQPTPRPCDLYPICKKCMPGVQKGLFRALQEILLVAECGIEDTTGDHHRMRSIARLAERGLDLMRSDAPGRTDEPSEFLRP